jgi:hypothetical protein
MKHSAAVKSISQEEVTTFPPLDFDEDQSP